MLDQKRARLDSLTGLRAIAAGLVFFNHFGDLFQAHFTPFVNRVLESGRCGVAFFFVLSGFVLTWSSRADDSIGAFYRRRVARIVPNHVVAWCLAAGLLAWHGSRWWSPASLGSLVLLQAWFPAPGAHFAGNAVAWSLSCEAFFYLLFPFLLPLVRRARPGERRAALVGLVLLGIGVPLLTQWAAGPVHTGSWFFYVFPGVRLIEFAIGILIAAMVADGQLPRIPTGFGYALAAVCFVAMQFGPISLVPVGAMLVPFAVIIAARAQADSAGARSLFGGRVWVRLGEWSYAFYLLHELVLQTLGSSVDVDAIGAGPIAALTALALVLTVAASAALYTWIEHPCERWLRAPRGLRVAPGQAQ